MRHRASRRIRPLRLATSRWFCPANRSQSFARPANRTKARPRNRARRTSASLTNLAILLT
jgi:hypothetical protein